MPNELERLLDLANSEFAYGPDFYRCMLESEIYALVPEVGQLLADVLEAVEQVHRSVLSATPPGPQAPS